MHCCTEMHYHLTEQEVAIVYIPRYREYGIKILDGGSAFQLIQYCPWCGQQLPLSLRDQWFEALDALNLEPDDPNVPDELMSDAWWEAAGL